MVCKDIRQYLQAKRPSLDLSFVDIIKDAFLKGEYLNLTPTSDQLVSIEASVPAPSVDTSVVVEPKDLAIVKETPPSPIQVNGNAKQ